MRQMTTSFSLTPFTLGDLRVVQRLEGAVFPEESFGMAEFLSLFLRGRDTFLVARTDGQVIGYIAAYGEGETGYIASVAVDPAYQRQGLGRALMETVMARLVEAGARVIGLHVRENNAAAIHLYETLGFKTRARIPNYYEDGAPGVYMETASLNPSH